MNRDELPNAPASGPRDTIEGSGYPLAFRLAPGGTRAPLFGCMPGAGVVRVQARAMGGHQKEAVVAEGSAAAAWRLVSDEGPILGGTDLAPAPLSFFCAGLQADLLGRLQALAPLHDVRIDAAAATAEHRFSFTGSFVSGTGQGATQPATLAIDVHTAAPRAAVTRLLQAAIQASPAVASLRTPLTNTFALYVNGRRCAVQDVHASLAPDVVDPFVAHPRRPAPVPGGLDEGDPIRRLQESEARPGPLPASGGSASIVVSGHARAALPQGTTAIETRLLKPPGTSFGLRSDERPAGGLAPSGLALLSAGVSFCYLTQLLRYVQHRRYAVRAIRLVQDSPFALEGSAAHHALQGRAGPVDTHLFLNGSAPDDVMQELLFYSARTCFLHAALGSAFEPQVTLSIGGGPALPVPLDP